MNVFSLVDGILIGLLFSATTVAATMWCVQLGVKRGLGAAWVAAGAVTVGQILWAMLAMATVGMLSWDAANYLMAAKGFCAMVFLYMAVKSVQSPKAKTLPMISNLQVGPVKLATATLAVMLSMPMRFFGLAGMMLTAGITRRPLSELDGFWVVAGTGAGTALWFGFASTLAGGARERITEEIWARAIWRQTRLAAVVYAGLSMAVSASIIQWWLVR